MISPLKKAKGRLWLIDWLVRLSQTLNPMPLAKSGHSPTRSCCDRWTWWCTRGGHMDKGWLGIINDNLLLPSSYCNQLHSSGSSLRMKEREGNSLCRLSSQCSLCFISSWISLSDLCVSQCQRLPAGPLSFLVLYIMRFVICLDYFSAFKTLTIPLLLASFTWQAFSSLTVCVCAVLYLCQSWC